MSFSRYSGQGASFVPSYQVSGVPWVTSSAGRPANAAEPTRFDFPTVTKSIMIKNTGNIALRVAFTKSGSQTGAIKDLNTGGEIYVMGEEGSSSVNELVDIFDVHCNDQILQCYEADLELIKKA